MLDERSSSLLLSPDLDGMCLVDGASGKILDVNGKFVRLLGRDRAWVIGRELAELAVDPSVVREALEGARQGIAAAHLAAVTLQHADGGRLGAELCLAVFQLDGRSIISVVLRDVTARTEARELLERRIARTSRQRSALLQLSSLEELGFEQRVRQILRVDADTLEVERVSIWSIRAEPSAIHLDALFRRAGATFESGLELYASDYPRYFAALGTGSVIPASDAHEDPRTSEFSEGYLRPFGIGALLDVPIYVHGQLVGVVCHEHVGNAREWSVDEQQFAISIGQMVSLAILTRERLRAEEAVRVSEARFRAMVEASPIPILVNSYPEGICLYANAAVAQLSGVPFGEMVGQRAPDFYEDPSDRLVLLQELRTHGFVRGRELQLRRGDGSRFWASVSVQPIDWSGQRAAVVGMLDLTERKLMEEALRHAALHDALTGLPNRAMFYEHVQRAIARTKRHHGHFAVLYVDLDGFKSVNDTFGHDAGDAFLQSIAGRLLQCLRPSDIAARLGGDEFGVLLGDLKSESEATVVASRIEDALRRSQVIAGREVSSSASIGVVLSRPEYDKPDGLLRDADTAMYRAKGKGKSRVELFA